MSYIKIKGSRENITVSKEKAEEIKKIWNDDTVADRTKLTVDSWNGTKGDIQSVWIDSESKEYEDSEQFEGLEDYLKERKQIQGLSYEERAKNTAFFKFLFYGFYDRKPNEEEIKKAEEVQKTFFEKNHFRCLPDPRIFFKGNEINSVVFRIVEKELQMDINNAHFNK